MLNESRKKKPEKKKEVEKTKLKLAEFIPGTRALLLEEHICNICTQFPFVSNDLFEFFNHLKSVHSIKPKEYFDTFLIEIEHNLGEEGSLNIFGLIIKKIVSEEKKEEKNKKPYLKINGEIVKRKTIYGIDSYERLTRIKKINKITREPFYFGGLRSKTFNYIPEIDDTFLLNEEFHRETISLLSAYGFRAMLLSGDTGLGKTESVKQICARMNQPVVPLKITGNTQVKHIFQDENYSPEEKKLVKVDKGIIIAAEMGAVLLVDEISAGSPSVNFTFFELLENNKHIIDLDGVKRYIHPMFKVVFTDNRIANPNYFRYHGTQEQNLALKNRIVSTIIYNNLKSSTERKILEMKYPNCDNVFVDNLVDIAKMIRAENEKGQFQEMMPIRTLQNICSNFEVFKNVEQAFFVGYINNIIDVVDREIIKGICQRKFGGGMFR